MSNVNQWQSLIEIADRILVTTRNIDITNLLTPCADAQIHTFDIKLPGVSTPPVLLLA